MIPGVGEVCASKIATCYDVPPGRLRIRWRRSDCHIQKRDSSLNTTDSMSQLNLALYHASLCCLWYGVSGKQLMAILDLKLASSNLFPTRWPLPIMCAMILAVIICLFVRDSRRILRSSRGIVLLDGPVPILLATLSSWVHLVTSRLAVIAVVSTFHKIRQLALSCPCRSSGLAVLRSLPEKVEQR